MTIVNPSPTRAPFDQERVRSKAVLSIDWTRGVATAITGQGATVTRAGNAFVTAGNGVLTPIGTNRLRLLHFVGANGGLLTEGARTNSFQRSEEFNDAYWTKTGLTITANADASPSGSLTADRLVESAATELHLVASPTFSLGASERAQYSLHAKRSSRRYLIVTAQRTATVFASVVFDLDTGLVVNSQNSGTSAAIDTISVTPVAGGYRRYTVSARRSTSGNMSFRFGFQDNTTIAADGGGFSVFAGDGASGGLVWGAQLEINTLFPTTYIPTVAATVTRPTDQVSYANFPQPAEIAARGGITVYHRFVEQGTRDTPTGMYWRVGDGVETTAASTRTLRIRQGVTPAGPNILLSNGAAVIGVGRANPQIGDTVEQLCQVRYTAAGNTFAVLLSQAINGVEASGAVFSTELDATALIASGWETTPSLYVGARDGGNQAGFQLNQALKARFGIHDLESMRTLV